MLTLTVGLLAACTTSSGTPKAPQPAWAENLAAQRDARTIDSAWRDGSERERVALEPLLRRYVERYPSDPRADAMQLRLAWLRIQQRDFEVAERMIRPILAHATGVDADLAQVLMSSLLGRRGQPVVALAHLRGMGSRLVDAEARDLWAREAVRIALLAGAADEAVSVMLAWRAVAVDESQEVVEQEILGYIERLDAPARIRALQGLTAAVGQPSAEEPRHRARVWMLEAVRESLGRFAERTKNGNLARRLLSDAPTRYLRSTEGEKLRHLAQSADALESTMHAAIGLLLELDTDQSSRASAELVTGAMRALSSLGKDEPVRLITRELRSLEPSEADRALTALVTDGAALLIAGLTPQTATIAARIAQASQIAVVLLAEPSEPLAVGPFLLFVESPDPQVERIFRESGPPSRRMSRLRADDAFCRADEHLGWTPEFLSSRGDLLVTADSSCALRLANEIRTRASNLRVWLGPDAARSAEAFDDASVITSSQFLQPAPFSPVALWQERFQRLPSWYEALGYDVTRLGIEAIRQRGFDSLHGDEPVRAARATIRDALHQVECDLMTTSDRGFGGRSLLRPTMVPYRSGAKKSVGKTGR